ncbi:MAG TPA: wax ester/triacylglycerol synthase family O-acyltransferase [Candidatus Dormibacteraeota bacterium]
MAAHTRATALEASFLALERPGLPMHVAGVVVFDATAGAGGPLALKDLRRLVAARAARLPKFRRRVSPGWLGLGRPGWVEADVDLDAHLFEHRLPAPGSTSQLAGLCAQIHADLLSRDRPLWEMHLIDGLAGERQALVLKTHHAITDGIGGMQVAEVLFDRARPHRRLENGGLPSLRFARPRRPTVTDLAQALVGLAFTVASGPIALSGPFNGSVGGGRAFAMATLPVDVIRRLKRRFGGSVDDVLLAVVAAGLSRRLARERYPRMPHALRAMLPVSTRPSAAGTELGNHVTAVFVDLPLDTSDLGALVRRIATAKSTLRTAHAAAGMSLLIEAAGRLPRALHETVVRFAAALPAANLIFSDLPGPDEPLFLLGHPITACYPMIPLSPALGLSVAAVSWDGKICIGIVADPDLVPQPKRLAAEIEAVVRALEKSQLRRPSSRQSSRPHRRAA